MPVNQDNEIPAPPFTSAEAGIIGDTIGIVWDQVDFSVDQFLAGLQVELEHGTVAGETDVTHDDPYETGKIAWAHLNEAPDYYEKLKAVEQSDEPAAQPAKDEGAVPMSPGNMAAPLDAAPVESKTAAVVTAVVKRCRRTKSKMDCPDKTNEEARWCLLTHDEKKALKCAPTRQEAAEHEKNVNFFKQGEAFHYHGAVVDIDYEPNYTVVTAALLRDAAQGRDVDDMDLKWDQGKIPEATKALDAAAIQWVQSDAFPRDDETFEMLDPVTDDRALPAKPDDYYPVFIKFCERYGLDVEDLEKRWGGRSLDHRLTAVARDFAHKIVPACTEQSRVCQDVGGAMAFAFVSRIPGVIYIAAETEGKQQFNFKPQLSRQYRDDTVKAAATGARRISLLKRNRDLRVAVLVNVKSLWNPKFAAPLQRSLTGVNDEPGQHPLGEDTEVQVPDSEVAREALNLYYTIWAATMETLYNFGKKVGNENVLTASTARLAAAISDQAFAANKLMPNPPEQNLPAEYQQFIKQNGLTKGFDVNQIVQWAQGTVGKTFKQWEQGIMDRWKQEKPAGPKPAGPPPIPGQGAAPPPVPQDAKKQKQGAVRKAKVRVAMDLDEARGLKETMKHRMTEMDPSEPLSPRSPPEHIKVNFGDGVDPQYHVDLSGRPPLDNLMGDPDVDAEIGKMLQGFGADQDPDGLYTVETQVGPLYCRIDHDALFCRFRDIQDAMALTDCDAHSGEWNQYFFDDESPERFLKRLRNKFSRVLPPVLDPLAMEMGHQHNPGGSGGLPDSLVDLHQEMRGAGFLGVKPKTKKLQKAEALADKALVALLQEFGAQQNLDAMYDYQIETPVGRLGCTVRNGELFCRFDDPDAAALVTDCNPYSGKWNFHYFGKDPATVVEEVRRKFSKLLDQVGQARDKRKIQKFVDKYQDRGAAVKSKVQDVEEFSDLGLRVGFVGNVAMISEDDGAGWTPANRVDWVQLRLGCTAYRCEHYDDWTSAAKSDFQWLQRQFSARP